MHAGAAVTHVPLWVVSIVVNTVVSWSGEAQEEGRGRYGLATSTTGNYIFYLIIISIFGSTYSNSMYPTLCLVL